jgi:hypothetical protein
VVAAHLVAERAGSAELGASADSAYVHRMGVVLLVCGIAALVSALPATVLLPGTAPASKAAAAPDLAAVQADARQ